LDGAAGETAAPRAPLSSSRWISYDAHELLEMIGELEDERRWARLREGVLWAVLFHLVVLLAIIFAPKYFFAPKVIEPNIHSQDRNQWTYLDSPPVSARPKVEQRSQQPRPKPQLDRKTLEQVRKEIPQPKPEQQPQQAEQGKPQTSSPIPPAPQTQSQIEAPRPSAVPARPNFAMNQQSPADQLRDAMRNSMRGGGGGGAQIAQGGMARHPGAGAGGVQILSDTQGVDFTSWIRRWYYETEHTWDPLIPDEVNPPILKKGAVQIRFKVGPNGRILEGSMVLEGRSGDVALDRAAWGALTGSNYPPLPADFHGPYLELRAAFFYNMRP
jgi:outer membrane biosynthesis protein TonB